MKNRPNKVLILGSAALKIGEAGEFDYSGSQAIKALKEDGVKTVLVNPNIATIQTSEHLADEVYFIPVTVEFVQKVIEKEHPDGILLSFGGQTALNCGLQLHEDGALDRFNVQVLGTPIASIEATENREQFVKSLDEINVATPRSSAVTSLEDALRVAGEIGYPVMVRVAYALGGLGSGLCVNEAQLKGLAVRALTYVPQILIEEYLNGWKEIEYEVVRDRYDNCITVCNMENYDPLGIHTGESIVVAPSQTLTNEEYHSLREISIRVVRHLGIVGECNVQFALDPHSQEYNVIEVNARLSRSSALASKATGYPLAFVAAKLGLGYGLPDLKNSITKATTACFEPALDYVVVKIPRWDLRKFRMVSNVIGSGMKSVGEVMAIGRSFEEALQKALRMLGTGVDGLLANQGMQFDDLEDQLINPTDERVFAVAQALEAGISVDKVHDLTRIDRWFLYRLCNIVNIAQKLKVYAGGIVPVGTLTTAKRAGFSDIQISRVLQCSEDEVRGMRHKYGLLPSVKQIDTLGAEYPAETNYLYLTYHGQEDDVEVSPNRSIIVLGSGAYRIGSSVEFDWCSVNTVMTLRDLGHEAVVINYNPETVSTDYDECDRLYFEELSFETVMDICHKERPAGVIVSVGGQVPNNIALRLHEAGLNILGTSPVSIDRAENRHKFSDLLDEHKIDQPEWMELTVSEDIKDFADRVGYPVLVRPSYVLSGAAMGVAVNDRQLEIFLAKATEISQDHPVVVSKFVDNAREIEFDGVAKNGEIIVHAISEHVENAGVHSGDATLVLPPQRTYLETIRRIKKVAGDIAGALEINGPFNIQFLAKDTFIKVIECNLRASRSFPFVSKIYRVNFIDIATRVAVGAQVPKTDHSALELNYVGVKAPQFSFTRLTGADPVLGVEMASTGEVACLGDNFEEAFLKALISVGYRFPIRKVLLSTGPIESKAEFLSGARLLHKLGVEFYATAGTSEFLQASGLPATRLHWPLEDAEPNAIDLIRSGQVDLVINVPKNFEEEEVTNDYLIRRAAADFSVPLITNTKLALRLAEALSWHQSSDLAVKSWGEYR